MYEFQASRFKGGRLFTPNVIRVWPDRVEEYEFHALRKEGDADHQLPAVSEVSLARGLVWSDISIESTGGKSFALQGVPKSDAERVKSLLDAAVAAAEGGSTGSPTASGSTAVPDVADQLRKLAELRDDGILTDEEFAAQKAKLLG